MNYSANNLQNGESVLISAAFSKVGALPWLIFLIICIPSGIVIVLLYNMLNMLAFGIVSCIMFIFIGFIPFIVAIIDIQKQELVVTNKRVLGKRGILHLHTLDLMINKIESVTISASFIGRMTGCYRITFSGSGTTKLTFYGVKNAEALKNAIASLSSD